MESPEKYLDWTNLMTYDLHGAWDGYLGHHTPLYARADERGYRATLNSAYIVNNWINKGYEPSKLLLGAATYARTFTMADGSAHSPGDGAVGAGGPGPYTLVNGILGYNEVCVIGGWDEVFDDQARVPHLYNPDTKQWVGYDNMESIALKAAFVCRQGMGGLHIWAMDMDDFTGQECNEGKYPLVTTAKSVLDTCKRTTASTTTTSTTTSTTTTTTTPTTTTTTTTTPKPTNPGKICQGMWGYYSNTDNEATFYQCVWGKPVLKQCAPGTVWRGTYCGWPKTKRP